jgi:hypothetical protein
MARFATADSQDHSPTVWILTLLTLIYTTLTTLVRAAIKFRMLGLDDGIAVFAQLLACGNAFSVIYALVHGLAREEPQDSEQRSRDGRLHYAGVSYTQTSVFILCAILTLTDTASEHRTLPFDIGGRESFHDLIPKKDFPTIKSLTRHVDMQHLRGNFDPLGRRSRHCSFCRLRSGTHVVVSRRRRL